MKKVLVVGGSGFLGNAAQEFVLSEKMQDDFVFAYNKNPGKIRQNLQRIRLDFLEKNSSKAVVKYPFAIYLAGNADHGLAMRNPSLDLELNAKAFLGFMEAFRGSLVLLSSQAVYYGLEGEVSEGVDHVSTIPYGLSKQMVEAYAKYFLNAGVLSKLWIFRLMYAFGKGEKERRLIPQCAEATRTGENVAIRGGGRSFLNPLPSRFVANVLVRAIESLGKGDVGFLQTTNLNHPEKVRVLDVVKFLNDVKPFEYTIIESGEEWPVKFWGDTHNLSAHLSEWAIDFPNLWDSLKVYFVELLGGRKHG